MNQTITKSLDTFFSGEDKVIVIKGAWGVGKTFFWDTYISERIVKQDLNQIAYSYVSLFGKNSLADVRAAIFQSAKSIASDEKIDTHFDEQLSDKSLLNRLPWGRELAKKATGKLGLINKLMNIAQAAPGTNKFSGIIAAFEYRFVNNYVVCFDDLERKGSSLSVREIMGLADELAGRKKCKVVLIFNDNSFSDEKDKKEFESYREKVVDTELDHNPTHEQNLACVIPATHALFDSIKEVAIATDLKNIRVIKKICRLIDTFWPELVGADELIVKEFVNHASVLCWSYYLRNTAIQFDLVKKYLSENSWLSLFGTKEKELSKEELQYRNIASTLGLSASLLDKHIIQYLEYGFIERDEVRGTIRTLTEKIDASRASNELSSIWKIYTDSFSNNQEEIINSFKRILTEHSSKLGLNEFAAAIDMLDEFGEDVSGLVDRYITLHQEQLLAMDRHDSMIARMIPYKPMLERIKSLQATQNNRNIDLVSMKIAVNRGWNPEDIDFLCSITRKEFIAWIKSNPQDLPIKLQSGLLFFGEIQTSNSSDSEKYKFIYENVRSAIVEIASETPLNAKRAKAIYRIDIPHAAHNV